MGDSERERESSKREGRERGERGEREERERVFAIRKPKFSSDVIFSKTFEKICGIRKH